MLNNPVGALAALRCAAGGRCSTPQGATARSVPLSPTDVPWTVPSGPYWRGIGDLECLGALSALTGTPISEYIESEPSGFSLPFGFVGASIPQPSYTDKVSEDIERKICTGWRLNPDGSSWEERWTGRFEFHWEPLQRGAGPYGTSEGGWTCSPECEWVLDQPGDPGGDCCWWETHPYQVEHSGNLCFGHWADPSTAIVSCEYDPENHPTKPCRCTVTCSDGYGPLQKNFPAKPCE